MLRTHTCGELTRQDVGKKVKLGGWIHSIRDHGGLLFIDLRDNYGITQCVIDNNANNKILTLASTLKLESVIFIEGTVVNRRENTVNENLTTGEIEVDISNIEIESQAEQLPFQINDDTQNYPEDLRLKYRYLDLRRQKIHKNIQLRSKVIDFLREEMKRFDFLEFHTPILTASSPEGARDFVVPSRVHPGKFYALPQAPQQFKQLLMVSGFDKYFQIAPCFRDEGTRADRALYFYQLDMEMSFATFEDVREIMEPVLYNTFAKFRPDCKVSDLPFPKIKFNEAMLKYGTDKPDLRNPIEICDVTELFKNSNFTVFAQAIQNDSNVVVRAIPGPSTSEKPRSFFDKIVAFAIEEGAKGLGYITWTANGEAKGPVAKFLNKEQLDQIKHTARLSNGDTVFFCCDAEDIASKLSGKIRTKLGTELDLIDKKEYKFCWIVDFPMYELNEETGKIDFGHNPFSMPQGGLDALVNTKNPYDILAHQFDIACNGFELASGAVRNHNPEIMYKAFEIAGYSKNEVDTKFGGMITAFKFGAPPHIGCAAGIERMLMLLCDENNLREVTAFPTNGKGVDLMMDAPAYLTKEQLQELNLDLSPSVKEHLKKESRNNS